MASTSVVFDIIARDRASGAFQKVGGAAKSSEGFASKLGSTFKTVAKAGALAATAAGAVAVKLGIDAVQSASDLNETINKTKTIFGSAAGVVLDFSKTAATELGQSRQQALAAASTFATFGKSAGLVGPDLSRFSLSLTRLSSDLASFHNTSPEEAIEAIGAGLRGEAEPLRRFGILLDDATLKAQAMRIGLIKNTKEALTPQQKVLAAQEAIFQQAGDASGDFQRTSGSLANQQKILKAQLENVQASIGQKLLPVAVKLFTWFNSKGLPALQAFGRYLDEKIPPAVAKVREVFNQAREVLARFTGDASSGVGSLSKAIAAGQKAWAQYGEYVRHAFESIKSIITDAVSIIQSLWRLFGDNIVKFAANSFKNLITVLSGAFDIITGVFKTVSALLRGDWRKAWDGIKLILRGAAKIVIGLVRQLFNGVQFAFKNAGVILKKLWSVAWDGIKALAKARATWVVEKIKSLPGLIKGLAGRYADAGRWVISKLMEIMRDKAREGGAFVMEKIRDLPGKIRELGGKFLEAGKDIIGKLISGLGNSGGAILDLGSKIKEAVNNALGLPRTIGFNLPGPGGEFSYTIGAFRNGTFNAPRGLALVGEDGPELIQFRGGERVHTASQTRAMVGTPRSLGASGGSRELHIHFHGPVAGDPRAFARETLKALLQHKRELGGNLGLA